jgi:hypothetical protein
MAAVETSATPDADPRYQKAKQRAEQVQGLLIHVIVYLVVNAGLFTIDALTGDGWWFFWPMLGWGLGLAMHAMVLFVPVFSPEWAEERARRQVESRSR